MNPSAKDKSNLKRHERTRESSHSLRVGNLNICRGINNKEALLLNMIETEKIDIIGVSEVDIPHFDEKKPFSSQHMINSLPGLPAAITQPGAYLLAQPCR